MIGILGETQYCRGNRFGFWCVDVSDGGFNLPSNLIDILLWTSVSIFILCMAILLIQRRGRKKYGARPDYAEAKRRYEELPSLQEDARLWELRALTYHGYIPAAAEYFSYLLMHDRKALINLYGRVWLEVPQLIAPGQDGEVVKQTAPYVRFYSVATLHRLLVALERAGKPSVDGPERIRKQQEAWKSAHESWSELTGKGVPEADFYSIYSAVMLGNANPAAVTSLPKATLEMVAEQLRQGLQASEETYRKWCEQVLTQIPAIKSL